jgi:transcriptional regulator with XRE-family HTH domain
VKFGKIIAFYRKGKGLTQAQLAELAHTNNEHINRIENERRNPSISMLQAIACALGIPLWVLFYGDTSAAAMETLLLLEDCTEGECAELYANLTAMKDNRRKFQS